MNKQLPKLNRKFRELVGATDSKIHFEQTQCSIELTFRMETEPDKGWLANLIDQVAYLLYFERDWIIVDERFDVGKEIKLKLRVKPNNPAIVRVFVFPEDDIPDPDLVGSRVGGHPELNTTSPFYIQYVELEDKDMPVFWTIMVQISDYARVATASAPKGTDQYASIVLD